MRMSIGCRTVDDSGIAGKDYKWKEETISFEEGEDEKIFEVEIVDDD